MSAGKKGFTLIELLVTLAVAVILATVAIPNFKGLVDRSKVSTSVNDVIKALNMAKSEAVKKNSNSDILISSDGLLVGPERFQVAVLSTVTLESTFGDDTITYNPSGWLLASGKVCIYDQGVIVREIEVSLSGMVTVHELDLVGCE
ncbi:GspH/FimT family pseudopilin [Halomonas alkalicola]|uniref:GspH/FimT family pseudopilin n=1 Tax=Halomonas alkalicola TaxID=1930622 RepID=UPI00265E78C6|nr:prepilin-type N-terminal cleavage/methylation domain-containing protein [Halomonas alkalicola]